MTKSELRQMIRECLREELAKANYLKESTDSREFVVTYRLKSWPASYKNTELLLDAEDEASAKEAFLDYMFDPDAYDEGDYKPSDEDEIEIISIKASGKLAEGAFSGGYAEGGNTIDRYGLKESAAMNWDSLIAEADKLLSELITKANHADYDDGDGYWSGDDEWCNRYLYYTRLLNTDELEKLCDEYSMKLPNVDFYFFDDEEDEISEIGFVATKDEEGLSEGIFDSKATKQKKYNQIIADAFDKKAPAAIATQIASHAERALSETVDKLDETNVASAKTAAKNFITAMGVAKTNAKKTPYGLLTSVISYVQKYNRGAMGLEELVEFKRTANHVQSHEKDGQKAIYYLMEIVNKNLDARLDKTIAFLKKEYSIH